MRVRLLEADYVQPRAQVGSEHDVDKTTARLLIERGVAEAVDATPQDAPAEVPSGPDIDEMASWTVAELRAWAEEHEIDVSSATRKQQVLDTIRAHLE